MILIHRSEHDNGPVHLVKQTVPELPNYSVPVNRAWPPARAFTVNIDRPQIADT